MSRIWGWPVTVDVSTAGGSAAAGTDFTSKTATVEIGSGFTSGTFQVQLLDDGITEPNETFTVNLSNASQVTIADAQGVGTIVDDDVPPSLSIGDVSIAEGNSGTKTATFTVSLSKAAASVVGFDVATANGTATAGSDFVALSLAGQQIAVGQSSKTVSVTINGDTAVEPDENFSVNVSNVTGATVSDGSATGTITNDDSAGGPTLSIGDVTISEGNSSTKLATFTVTLSAVQSGPVQVDVATANGTATSGSDYVAKSTLGLRIPAGSTSKTFAVTINGDTTSEPDETFTVNLTNPVGATLADGQAVGTITNDDAAATPTLSIADASVAEGNSGTKTLTFTVSLSPAAAGTVSYDIATSNGTATSGSDYVASSLLGQTIAAGGTSKTFVVTINGDTSTEANETFNVTLSNVSGATLGDGSAVGTITNDDGGSGPSLSIADVSIAEGNSLSRQATFTVSLSAAATSAVTYTIATANGTAIAPGDYTAKTLTGVSIAAGATSKTFTVAIKGDTVAEPNETFTVNVSSVTGATVADGSATGTITNDDAAVMSVARFDSRGLVDDIDDRNGEPQLSSTEYATLLLDTTGKLCERTNAATIVAVDGIESRNVLADLADTANATCASKPRYTALMGEGMRTGFLVEEGTGALDKPSMDAAGIAGLRVLGAGHDQPLTLLVPRTLSASASARKSELAAIGRSVQAQLKFDADAHLVLIGGVTVPGLRDLTARDFVQSSPTAALPAERVLISPALLKAFGKTRVEFVPPAAKEAPAQLLKLQ
jgi:chitinase